MALTDKSLFLYNLEVNSSNNYIDFRATMGGPILSVTVDFGFYSLTDLMTAVAAAMRAADPTRVYAVTADRSINAGTENRVTITTNGTYLDLLFASGPHSATSIRSLIGFPNLDKTGATSYTGSATCGTPLITDWYGNNWIPPQIFKRNFGAVNVATNGAKEAVTFAIQEFMQVEFKFESTFKVENEWPPLISWFVAQKPFDFTPEISNYDTVYSVTLEKSADDGKGLGFMMREMIPEFPFLYTTQNMTFRRRSI